MLDIKFIRQNVEKVKDNCRKRQMICDVDEILGLDEKRRTLIGEIEEAKAEQKKLGKDDVEHAKKLKLKIKEVEPKLEEVESSLNELLLQLPNMLIEDVPIGEDENSNEVVEEIGEKTNFNFEPKDYLTLTEQKGDLIDVKRAVKTSGARFGLLKGEVAMLELALINFAFEKLMQKGFVPVFPPVMLKSKMARRMGYFEQASLKEAYYFEADDLFLVGTSEQSIGTMHCDEIFDWKELPKRYVAFSSCFRREAGASGKDTKGILRVHQFDKIEMFSFCKPEESLVEHQMLLETEKELMKELELPFRVVHLCSGDIGLPSASTYDIETWIPSEGKYRETHSTSNCIDFQARRLNTKYRDENGVNFVHTLNGTVFAIPRMLIAIIENYQKSDGSIEIPKALQKYTGFKEIK